MANTRELAPNLPPMASGNGSNGNGGRKSGNGGKGGKGPISRLLSTRRGSIFLAVGAALLALAVLVVFMTKYKDSVAGGGGDLKVLVADENIDVGTSGDVISEFGLFRTETVSGDEELEGAITDPSGLNGQVVTEAVDEGQQFTEGILSGTSDPVVGKIEGVQRAISVPVGEIEGNIGTIKAGTQVDVYGVPENGSVNDTDRSFEVLARDLTVLRVPSGNEEEGGVSSTSRDVPVVLRATDVESGRIAYAAGQKDIWLVVRPPTRAEDSKIGQEDLAGLEG